MNEISEKSVLLIHRLLVHALFMMFLDGVAKTTNYVSKPGPVNLFPPSPQQKNISLERSCLESLPQWSVEEFVQL